MLSRILLIVIALVAVFFLIKGCTEVATDRLERNLDPDEYEELRSCMADAAVAECRKRGMEIACAYMISFDTWKASCYTESPLKFYEVPIQCER